MPIDCSSFSSCAGSEKGFRLSGSTETSSEPEATGWPTCRVKAPSLPAIGSAAEEMRHVRATERVATERIEESVSCFAKVSHGHCGSFLS